MSVAFPSELIARSEAPSNEKLIAITPELEVALPGIRDTFETIDDAFEVSPHASFVGVRENLASFESNHGRIIYSLDDENTDPDRVLVRWAPLSETAPKSSPDRIYDYTMRSEAVGFKDKERKVRPHTWSEATKALVTSDVLWEREHEAAPAVLSIFTPLPLGVYSPTERVQQYGGDFTPAGRIVAEALDHAYRRINGSAAAGQFKEVDLSGASLGATNVVGAALDLHRNTDYRVTSVTAQELILADMNLLTLAKRYTVAPHIGEASLAELPEDVELIKESLMRRRIDVHGSEAIGMAARMLKGMAKMQYMMGLTKPEHTAAAITELTDADVPVLVALAANSAVSQHTASFLPEKAQVLKVVGMQGEKSGHLINEHVALSALITLLGVSRRKTT